MLRVKGLECLVLILKCMVEWSREYYIDPATTGLKAVRVVRGDDPELSLPVSHVAEEDSSSVDERRGSGSHHVRDGSSSIRAVGELGKCSLYMYM